MNPIQRLALIATELESIRQQFHGNLQAHACDVVALVRCIHARCFEPEFNIEAAFAHCSIASHDIYPRFKRAVGRTPAKYLEWCRLVAACRLLQYPQISISEIAQSVGLNARDDLAKRSGEYSRVRPPPSGRESPADQIGRETIRLPSILWMSASSILKPGRI